jgi:hypothetical protein
MKIKVFKRKVSSLIERIKLSEAEFEQQKAKLNIFHDMCSNIEITWDDGIGEVRDKDGNIIYKFHKIQSKNININVKKMIQAMGIVLDNNTKINIIDED